MRIQLLLLPALLTLISACGSEPSPTLGQDPLGGDGDDPPDRNGTPADEGPTSSGDDSRDTDDDNSAVCTEYSVSSSPIRPRILVVFDRSLSMIGNGWEPAVSAVQTVTAKFEKEIEFGLMVFPDAGGFTCSASAVDVPIKANNAGAIKNLLTTLAPWGNTPTAAALKTAQGAMGGELFDMGQVIPPKYVVLITDGAPNCAAGGVDEAMVTECIGTITAMARDDVKTYVLGYHIAGQAEKDALDRMAVAGATGDKAHRDIGDQQALVAQFQEVVGAARSCKFELDQKIDDPKYVRVQLDNGTLPLDGPDGWVVGEDMQSVSVQGKACVTLRGGEAHNVSVGVECSPIF
ncbi:MAG: vWA domain-containing protein [Myxococcales bacterium]